MILYLPVFTGVEFSEDEESIRQMKKNCNVDGISLRTKPRPSFAAQTLLQSDWSTQLSVISLPALKVRHYCVF